MYMQRKFIRAQVHRQSHANLRDVHGFHLNFEAENSLTEQSYMSFRQSCRQQKVEVHACLVGDFWKTRLLGGQVQLVWIGKWYSR
jgi:hypothetical protein